MIITISGKPGTGKSTVAKILAEQLKMKHYSTGDLMREMARERDLTLMEITELASKDPTIDKQLDQRQKKLGKDEDNFIIDARIGFHWIPHSVKIFCDASIEVAAQRVFNSRRRTEKPKSLQATEEALTKRIASEKKRYKSYYDLDYYDMKHYDLVIDTDGVTVQEMVDAILKFLKDGKHIT